MGGSQALAIGNAVLNGSVAMGAEPIIALILIALLATTVVGIVTLLPRRRGTRSLRVAPALRAH